MFNKLKAAGIAGLIGTSAVFADVPHTVKTNSQGSEVSSNDQFLQDLYSYIKQNEGTKSKMYKDDKGNLTIGVGHLVLPSEVSKFKGRTLKDKEIQDIFQQDIKGKITLAKKLIGPAYDEFSPKLKIAVIDGMFRGDLSGSPRTIKLLKNKQFKSAAKEYINNKDYKKSKAKKSGVYKRMDRNAEAMAYEIS